MPLLGLGPQSAKNGAAKSVRSVPPRWSTAPHAAVPATATAMASTHHEVTLRLGTAGRRDTSAPATVTSGATVTARAI
jgi:hypothetical protein